VTATPGVAVTSRLVELRLDGKVALVTGASKGIGKAIAAAYAAAGADVMISSRKIEALEAARDEITASCGDRGGQVDVFAANAGDVDAAAACVSATIERFGGLDILVNNAAHQVYHQTFDELDEQDLDRTIQTNLYAMFWITRDALPHLRPGSTIINSTSVQGYNPSPMIINYASTKFAIIGFTKALAADLAPRGIRVNAVAPGPVWTPLQVSDGQPSEKLDGFGDSSWLGRTSQPVEQAPAYVFLASPESSFVVGEVINVNGGAHVP